MPALPRLLLRPALPLLAALFALAAPAYAQQADLEGTWSGTVTQADRKDGYDIILTIGPTTASTQYPSLFCAGALDFAGAGGSYLFYVETIKRGRLESGGQCIDGTVTLVPNGDGLAYGWFGTFEGKTVTATAQLSKQQ